MNIKLDLIKPSTQQVRSSWDEDKMVELAQSIREQGVIVPVKVRPVGSEFELVYGHRRVEAARRVGLAEIPAIVEGMEDRDSLIQALIENVQREDMEPIDEAKAYKRLQKMGLSTREIAKKVGKSQYIVIETLSVLSLPEPVQSLIARPGSGPSGMPDGKVSIYHVAEATSGIKDDLISNQLVGKAADEGLTVMETRHVAQAVKAAADEAEREAIIETPYHDPAFDQLVRAKAAVTRHQEREERQQHEEEPREVKEFLVALRSFSDVIRGAESVVKFGKFSPEAKRFTTGWIDGLIRQLTNLKQILEEEGQNA